MTNCEATMKYKLSFCEIEQLSDNIFEVTVNEGSIIDNDCSEEALIFWKKLRTKPYRLLVNNKNRFSYSFVGGRNIGAHPLEERTAILLDDESLNTYNDTVKKIKSLEGDWGHKKNFQDREEAIKWLETS